MTDTTDVTKTTERSRTSRLVAGAALTITVIAVAIFGVMQLGGNNQPTMPASENVTEPAGPGITEEGDDVDGYISSIRGVLPEPMNGQEAIDALGDDIEAVARRNGKTVEELKEMLLRDSSVHISTSGFILFLDNNAKRG